MPAIYNLQCYQNKNRDLLGKDCNATQEFELVNCTDQVECAALECDVCLKFRIDYHDTGVIKSCGHNGEKMINITGGSCKLLSNKENWEFKKEIVKGWKQLGMNVESNTEVFDNQSSQEVPQSIMEEPHCWDEFATSKEHHILEACECVGNGTGCNGAPKPSMPTSFNKIFAVSMIVIIQSM